MARLCPSLSILALSFLFKSAHSDIQCLVSRAGVGLVSEHCPAHTVGCRIRIQRNAVTFYDYLDSNQFVCVLKGEFGEQRSSGCVRKRSGNIRCWCFGRSNCNTVENAKLIYEAFVSGNEQKLLDAIQRVDFADLAEKRTETNGNGTTPTTTTTTMPTSHTVRAEHTTTFRSTTALGKTASSTVQPPPPAHAAPPSTTRWSLQNSTLQSEYDKRNRVHVIHVSSRDQYEPVFGSAALRRIMAREQERLKAESEAISAEIEDDYEEEEDGEGTEDGDGLASSSSSFSEHTTLGQPRMPTAGGGGGHGASISRRVAQRSEMAKPKTIRMEQREKSSSSSASGEALENALGDEYFDSSFFAPASSSACYQPSIISVTFHALLLCRFLTMID